MDEERNVTIDDVIDNARTQLAGMDVKDPKFLDAAKACKELEEAKRISNDNPNRLSRDVLFGGLISGGLFIAGCVWEAFGYRVPRRAEQLWNRIKR